MSGLIIQGVVLGIIVFLLTVVAGYILLPLINRMQLKGSVRSDGPASHQVKTGTPIFGGLFFLLPIGLTAFILPLCLSSGMNYAMLTLPALLFGAVGFADDYIKVRINKEGLSIPQKTIAVLVSSAIFASWYLWFAPQKPYLLLPFAWGAFPVGGFLAVAYFIFLIVYLFAAANAVNFSDGVDGLCSSLSIVMAFFFALTALKLGGNNTGMGAPFLFSLTLIGGCLGFLVFNHHPAKIFMGDTGSLALGGALAGLALYFGAPWLMLVTGIIFVAEAVSVIIQVFVFRKFNGKRFFRMAPLHHHYELGGWSESKVLFVFCSVAAVGGLIGLIMV